MACIAKRAQGATACLGLASLLSLWAGAGDAGTITYGYDALGRLTSVAYPDGSCLAYAYDSAGNRTQYVANAGGPPPAGAVNLSAFQDLPATFDPRSGAPSCRPLSVTAVGAASHGSATVLPGGVGVTYTPAAGYTGSDSFSYTIYDGSQHNSGQATVNIQAPTLAPVANNTRMNFTRVIPPPPAVTPIIYKDVTPLVSDPYGYTLSIVGVTNGTVGTVSYSGLSLTYRYNALVSYNLDDADNFSYTVTDGHGHTATATVAVAIHVITRQ